VEWVPTQQTTNKQNNATNNQNNKTTQCRVHHMPLTPLCFLSPTSTMASSGADPAAIVWMHGLGDSSAGWSGIEHQLKRHLPHVQWYHRLSVLGTLVVSRLTPLLQDVSKRSPPTCILQSRVPNGACVSFERCGVCVPVALLGLTRGVFVVQRSWFDIWDIPLSEVRACISSAGRGHGSTHVLQPYFSTSVRTNLALMPAPPAFTRSCRASSPKAFHPTASF